MKNFSDLKKGDILIQYNDAYRIYIINDKKIMLLILLS